MKLALRALPSFVVLLAACSSTGSELGAGSEALAAGGADVLCACALDQVCDAGGKCVARPEQNPAEAFASFEVLNQVSLGDTSILGHLAEASSSFNAGDPLPPDTRPKFSTDGGEDCFFEVGTTYPSSYGKGQYWPSTPGLAAGKVTFDVVGAPGAIELEAFDDKNYGWGYLHTDTPAALSDGRVTYADFFDPAYVPADRMVFVNLAGGADVTSHAIAGALPQAFSITAPAVEAGNATSPLGADLDVTWSPAQPSAYMEIFVTMDLGGDIGLLSCKVKDDGAVVVPAAAMGIFKGQIGLQLRRTTERYTKIQQKDGKIVHASVLGRHARVGTFTLTSSP
jgi:hypothetical protein